jgi:translocation and assembly module TamA
VVSGDTSLAFLRLQSQVSAYLPVEDQGRTVIAGRLRLGAIGGGSFEGVPSDRRFFSGGGGSVRGYSYQGVGPRLPDNTPRGGLSLVETSLEVRRDLFGNFGAVVFVDGGAVGDNTAPDFSSVQWSVGAGVRYNLPFGPIRADIAIPLNKRDGDPGFQIYVSIGQAF